MSLRLFQSKRNQKMENNSPSLQINDRKRFNYLRLKPNRQKSLKTGRSLCSIQTYRNSNRSNSKTKLSHRKLISSVEQKQNLTERKCTAQSDNIIGSRKNANFAENIGGNLQSQRNDKNDQKQGMNKKNFHLNKFCQYDRDRLYTIQNDQSQNLQKVLQIKQNILKQFIDRFQQQLREISQQKSSRKTILTNRIKTQSSKQKDRYIKDVTTKKQRFPMREMELNGSTINVDNNKGIECEKDKKTIKLNKNYEQSKQFRNNDENNFMEMQQEKNKFENYVKQLQNHKKKDHKILVLKNHKKSMQNINISKISQTENFPSRASQQSVNNRLNLKELFKHSRKYEPFLRESSTIEMKHFQINLNSERLEASRPQSKKQTLDFNRNHKIEEIKQKQQNQQKSFLMASPIKKPKEKDMFKQQNIENTRFMKESGYADCSSIQKMNQSSFISDMGRKSLLKHLENQSIKLMKDEQRKSKKCLAKMKNIFPTDFF